MSGILSKEEKIAVLRKEFDDVDVNHDDGLTEEELYQYLDRMGGREFDRNVAQQLFERMDKNYDQKITREEFINTFLEAEEILNFKIENSKKYIEDYQTQKRNAISRLEEIKRTEVMNSYGIMEDSTLSVNVIEGHNLGSRGDMDIIPYCFLAVGEENYTTNEVHSANPLWNDNFSFKVQSGRETLEIQVLNAERNSDNKLGKVSIQINGLRDQLKHDEWYDLEKFGNPTGGRIHLNLQWIHSKVKFLSDVVEKWDDHIKMQKEDLYDYEKDLEILYSPFGRLVQLYKGGPLRKSNNYQDNSMEKKKKKVVDPYDNYDDFEAMNARKVATNSPPPKPRVVNIDPKPEVIPSSKSASKFDYNNVQKLLIDKIALVISIIIAVFALFICFNRSVYLDLIIASAFITYHHLDRLDAQKLKIFAGCFAVSLIIDLPWLIIYNDPWWNAGEITINDTATSAATRTAVREARNSLYDTEMEQSLLRFVIVFSYFLLVLKVIAIGIYYVESGKFNTTKVSSGK